METQRLQKMTLSDKIFNLFLKKNKFVCGAQYETCPYYSKKDGKCKTPRTCMSRCNI